MPSQDIRKFTPVSYRTSVLWGRCPALTPPLQVITPSRASGTADHVQSLDDLFYLLSSVTAISEVEFKDGVAHATSVYSQNWTADKAFILGHATGWRHNPTAFVIFPILIWYEFPADKTFVPHGGLLLRIGQNWVSKDLRGGEVFHVAYGTQITLRQVFTKAHFLLKSLPRWECKWQLFARNDRNFLIFKKS